MVRVQKYVIATVLIILTNPMLLCLSTADTLQDAIFFIHDKDGLMTVRKTGLHPIHREYDLRDPYVVWSHYLTDAIYQTTSNTVSGYVFAGTFLNPPREAQLFALSGGGNPEWGHAGTTVFTDAGAISFTLAAIDTSAAAINVHKWTGPGTSTPDWTTSIAGYTTGTDATIAVSDNGSTIAVLAGPQGGDAHLLLFDADSSTPLIDYPAAGLGFPRFIRINYDGRYVAFIALATLVIFDRDLLSVRSQISMGFSNSALDISGDGNLIAYGWPTLQVREWNGSSYQSLWSWSPGGMYVNHIAISNDGNTIVSCWYNTSFNTIKIAVHDRSSSTPLWTYDYVSSNGTYQELADDVEITDDGKYFVVGSLGDINNLNPEVHIFQRDNLPHVYYTVDMPGSMFSVDISNDGRYATACGKHIHANVNGRGGDIVMIDMDLLAVSESKLGHECERDRILDAYPNPFNGNLTIAYCTGQSATHPPWNLADGGAKGAVLRIYDAAGHLVKLFALGPVRSASIAWSGDDDSGNQVPAGVYFVRLTTGEGEGAVTGRLVLVR